MENLTHSLVGAALSGAALGESAPAPERRLVVAAGIVSANAPDVDLLYTWITPAPLGYLLHHRGHTHTVVGVIALAALLTLIWMALPGVRRRPPMVAKLAMIMLAGVSSHLLLDAGNSYGVHPFYPIDLRWYYGDSLFIFEPLLWLLLAGTAAVNARSRIAARAMFAGAAGLTIATGATGVVPWPAIFAVAAMTGTLGWMCRRLRAQARWAAAIAAVALFCGVMFALSRVARTETIARLPSGGGAALLDVVLTPNPAFPVCWAVIAIEADEQAGELRLRRGSISLAPRVWPAAACPLQQIAGGEAAAGSQDAALAVVDDVRVPLQRLRTAAATDCRVSAWLRFVRAPVLTAGRAYDLRFARAGGGNFTGLPLASRSDDAPCPAFVPAWSWPRADALSPR